MFSDAPPPQQIEMRAEGMLLGLALAQRRVPSDRHLGPTEALLVAGVAQAILETGEPAEDDLVSRWKSHPDLAVDGSRGQTDLVLELTRRGSPWAKAVETAARLTSRPELDPPLLRVLPIAIATLGRGLQLRRWTRRVTAVTHPDPISQLTAFAVARLAQDLLCFGLEDALPRTAQAGREGAPESLIAALKPSGPGEEVPAGEDARGVLAATVQSLAGATSWKDAVSAATTRGIAGDQAVLLTGALAGALLGVPDQEAGRHSEQTAAIRQLAQELVAHGRAHAHDPLPAPTWLPRAVGSGA
ncbi:MAG: ADP-ribosylglycohydrolase family protein [Candidatus Dormibacteria bacterium]